MKTAFALAGFILMAAAGLQAADLWMAANTPGVSMSNDCGNILHVSGSAWVKPAFAAAEERGARLFVSDRLNGGDTINTSGDGLVEFVTGNNILTTVGPGSIVHLGGVRTIPGDGDAMDRRFDLTVEKGEVRVQVRLNQSLPEHALVEAGPQRVLLSRGDFALSTGGVWSLAAIAGEVSYRYKGTGMDAPLTLQAGESIVAGTVGTMAGNDVEKLTALLPFSYELFRAALPPTPPPDPYDDAP